MTDDRHELWEEYVYTVAGVIITAIGGRAEYLDIEGGYWWVVVVLGLVVALHGTGRILRRR